MKYWICILKVPAKLIRMATADLTPMTIAPMSLLLIRQAMVMLMVSVMSTFFVDGDQACNGMASFIPVSAFMRGVVLLGRGS